MRNACRLVNSYSLIKFQQSLDTLEFLAMRASKNVQYQKKWVAWYKRGEVGKLWHIVEARESKIRQPLSLKLASSERFEAEFARPEI